ncbi:MAG: quinone oxidoreductase [Devosia sp.]|nr:quinone oxidoreductase [Devosia sp.]
MTKGFLVKATGGPEVMEWTEVEIGAPGPGQLRIRNAAVGLNFIDTYQRSGLYKVDLPFVPGNDGVGIIEAIGDGVSDFKVGDRVAYTGPVGAYAEARLLTEAKAFAVPDGIGDATVAGMLTKGLTAYYLLHLTWPLQAGESTLIHAAAGGVGLIATQWAKSIGATVYGTAGSAEKVAIAAPNCDAVINYTDEDFAARIKELTGGRGVDVVYDGVGKATFDKSLDCLRPRGLMVSFGNASGVVSIPDLTVLSRKGSLYVTRPTTASYFPTKVELRAAAKATFDAMLAGRFKVSVNHKFPLRDAQEAHRLLESRGTTGSVVLVP